MSTDKQIDRERQVIQLTNTTKFLAIGLRVIHHTQAPMQHFRILQSSELEFDLNSNLLLIVMCRDDLPDNSLAVVSQGGVVS